MSRRRANPVLGYIRKLAAAPSCELADEKLVERFVASGDEAAFANIVRRHGSMVLSLCLRVLGNQADAEDAFQATFLVLSRKAASLRKHEALGGWLHSVAYRIAQKARLAAARRRSHERRAADRQVADHVADLTLREAHAILDRELARLPDKLRAPSVLCYLEGLTRDQAARQLCCSPNTFKGRLDQARERLRTRFASRGLALSGALVASLFWEQTASAAVTTVLLASTVKAATTVAAGGAASAVVSARVVALSKGVLQAMFLTKLKAATLVAVLVGAIGAASTLLLRAILEPALVSASAPAGEKKRGAAPRRAAPKPLKLKGTPSEVLWSPNGRVMASVSRRRVKKDGGGGDNPFDYYTTVRLLDARTGAERCSLGELKNSGMHSLGFSPTGDTLAISIRNTIAEGDRVELWDTLKGELRRTVEMDYGRSFLRIAFSPDGKTLAVAYGGPSNKLIGGTRLFDTRTGELKQTLLGHKSLVTCVAFSSDGKLLATAGDQHDQEVRLWEVKTGKVYKVLSKPECSVQSLAFSADGKTLASGSTENGIQCWDVRTGAARPALQENGENISRVTFSRDGRLLAGGGTVESNGKRSEEIKLWDVRTGKLLRTWTGTTASMAFVPDDRTLAVLGTDGTVRYWAVAPLAEVKKQAE